MRGPRHKGEYPDRAIDCQEDVSQGIMDLIEQSGASGTEADVAKAIAKAPSAGNQALIEEAISVGWTAEETIDAIKVVATGLNVGYTGTDINE